ncbi:MAG: ComF family protein [Acidimicrobiales bacterium]
MTTTDALAGELVPVPSDAPDVCPMCRSWRPSGSHYCNNCDQAFRDVSEPCPTVVPICLYSKPSSMRDRMTFYKDPKEPDHARYPNEVAAILDRYFFEHGGALADCIGGWDNACLVPSATRLPPHPLELALMGLPASYVPERSALLQRHTGEVDHRKLSNDAYRPVADVSGHRILILDDVYTTGARSQSAASSLALGGAKVAGIVVIARRVNPAFNPGVRALWDRQKSLPFSFGSPPWWQTD